MSYGFKILSGEGKTLLIASSDEVPGVLIDYFYFDRLSMSSMSRSYPNFQGTAILATAITASTSGMHDVLISVNQSTKTVNLTARLSNSVNQELRKPAWVTVMGV
jgi:hypothetical protein